MRLPVVSSRDLCRFLEKEGFVLVRQKGSHCFFRHPDGRTTLVPMHPGKPVSRGLLGAILDEIGMSREDFQKKFK